MKERMSRREFCSTALQTAGFTVLVGSSVNWQKQGGSAEFSSNETRKQLSDARIEDVIDGDSLRNTSLFVAGAALIVAGKLCETK